MWALNHNESSLFRAAITLCWFISCFCFWEFVFSSAYRNPSREKFDKCFSTNSIISRGRPTPNCRRSQPVAVCRNLSLLSMLAAQTSKMIGTSHGFSRSHFGANWQILNNFRHLYFLWKIKLHLEKESYDDGPLSCKGIIKKRGLTLTITAEC